LAWLVAQVLKMVLVLIRDRKFDFSRLVGAGGMPSSHSALMCAMTVCIFRTYGFSSPISAVSIVITLVVMYDASGVRRAAGKQAKILNILLEKWNEDDGKLREERLKELLGHTPLEVFAGALLGVVIGGLLPL
jgi:acid phosphatase family membrane protein YuiD